jgi:hypothetical protein
MIRIHRHRAMVVQENALQGLTPLQVQESVWHVQQESTMMTRIQLRSVCCVVRVRTLSVEPHHVSSAPSVKQT